MASYFHTRQFPYLSYRSIRSKFGSRSRHGRCVRTRNRITQQLIRELFPRGVAGPLSQSVAARWGVARVPPIPTAIAQNPLPRSPPHSSTSAYTVEAVVSPPSRHGLKPPYAFAVKLLGHTLMISMLASVYLRKRKMHATPLLPQQFHTSIDLQLRHPLRCLPSHQDYQFRISRRQVLCCERDVFEIVSHLHSELLF